MKRNSLLREALLAWIFTLMIVPTAICVGQEPTPLPDDEFTRIVNDPDTLKWLAITAMTDNQAKQFETWAPLHINPLPGKDIWLDGLPLRGLETLGIAQAKSLAKAKAAYIILDAIASIDATALKALADFSRGSVSLNGLTALDDAQAAALGGFKASVISLKNLRSLSAVQASKLARFKGAALVMPRLAMIDSAGVVALSKAKCRKLHLDELDNAALKQLEDAGGRFAIGDVRRVVFDVYKDGLKSSKATK